MCSEVYIFSTKIIKNRLQYYTNVLLIIQLFKKNFYKFEFLHFLAKKNL